MKPTNEVLYNMIENLSKNFENYVKDTREYHKSHDEKQEKILSNVVKTNGRVNKIEPLALDYQVNRERIKGAIMFGSVVSVLIISMFMYMGKLYIDSKEATITQLVSQAVYDKIIKEFDVVVNK